MSIPGFSKPSFEYEGVEHGVYRRGEGPGVVVMHELLGLTPETTHLAERIADAGFTVFVPHFFGTPNRAISAGYAVQTISREFATLSARRASPITTWLRALCRSIHEELGGKGIGAIGMCLSGNFALSLMVDEAVMAPVLSQPSLPTGLTRGMRRALHMSDEDLATVKERVANGVCILGLRFTHDKLCPPARFERLREEFGDGFEGIEIDSSPGNPHGHPKIAHAVLTEHLVDKEGEPTHEALERVLAFLDERLK